MRSGGKTAHRLLRVTLASPLIGLALAGSVAAQELPSLEVPVDCDLSTVCSIQNYVDARPGADARDYTCGTLTYDGHQGTDFQVPDLATMRYGVAVFAAAGTVRNTRDGSPDRGIDAWRRSGKSGEELGNAVAIMHGNGWETLYGHLRQGSVTVSPGDRISAGHPLGMIGLSGKTAFPHVHFQLLHKGQVVDPFSGKSASSGCGEETTPLWSPTALSHLGYRGSVLVCGGLAVSEPQRSAIREECPSTTEAPRNAGALVAFAEFGGVWAGDRIRLAIIQPDGRTLVDNEVQLEKTRARQFRYVGKNRPSELWQTGSYTAHIVLTRRIADKDRVLIDVGRSLAVR